MTVASVPSAAAMPHRRLAQPDRHHVGEGVPPEVPERLGDEEEHDRPADQPAGGVDQPVEPGGGDQPRDAEKRRGAHVVAGQREAVLARR